MTNRLLAQRGRSGHTPYSSKALLTTRFFKSRRKKRKRGSGKFIPDVWEPPRGGAWARGANGKPLSTRRANGAYRTRPWAGRGAASSEQATSKQDGKWLGAPWGAHGQGVRTASPYRPVGRRGLPGAPLGGAGENCSRQGYCAPELRGRKGLTSSICVIIACDNIHRISPHFVLRLIMEPRGICLSWCKHDRSHKDSKEPRGICYRFFRLLPTCKGGT